MWNVKRLTAVLILACAVIVSTTSGVKGKSEPEAAELVQAVRASENWLHDIDSLYIRIETKLTRTPEAVAAKTTELKQQYPDLAVDSKQFPQLKPVSMGVLEFAIDKARVRSLSEEFNSRRKLRIWDGKQLIVCDETLPGGPQLYTLSRAPQGSFQDMLAYETSWPRAQPHSFWWDYRDVEELMNYYGHAEDSCIAGRRCYRGTDCYVLDMPPRGIPGLVTVQSYPGCEQSNDRRNYGLAGEAVDLAGQSFRWYVGVKDHKLHGLVWLSGNKPRIEYWMSDYKDVRPGYWLPMRQGCEVYRKDNSGTPCIETHSDLKVVDARINEPLPDELFRMQIKEGATVTDSRSGRTITYTYEPEPPNLVGKALPESDDASAGLVPNQVKDSRMLVCFWDMQQRPSRHCLESLAEKAGNFADRGISVLCVHASKVDEQALNKWMKDYNVPFAAKTITRDVEKTCFAWGVKSLPWLILTDRNHIIVSEGFQLGDLDRQLEQVKSK
jgi:hypothetical protein